jgi:hypothetical protein
MQLALDRSANDNAAPVSPHEVEKAVPPSSAGAFAAVVRSNVCPFHSTAKFENAGRAAS